MKEREKNSSQTLQINPSRVDQANLYHSLEFNSKKDQNYRLKHYFYYGSKIPISFEIKHYNRFYQNNIGEHYEIKYYPRLGNTIKQEGDVNDYDYQNNMENNLKKFDKKSPYSVFYESPDDLISQENFNLPKAYDGVYSKQVDYHMFKQKMTGLVKEKHLPQDEH